MAGAGFRAIETLLELGSGAGRNENVGERQKKCQTALLEPEQSC